MNARASVSALRAAPSSAVELYAKPSPDYVTKLAHARLVLREAAELGAVTQANSLGVEDMVISHIINALALPIPIFVLDTGRLHTETLALLERLQAHSRAPVQVIRPRPEMVRDYIRAHGQDAIYESIDLRKQCCAIRKLEPLGRALAGKAGWITGLRREQSGARADVPTVDRSEARITVRYQADISAIVAAKGAAKRGRERIMGKGSFCFEPLQWRTQPSVPLDAPGQSRSTTTR